MDFSGPSTTVSILRPHNANKGNLELQQFIHESESGSVLADKCSVAELQQEVQRSDTLREIIEWTANREHIPVDVHEYQIRRRDNRDCYTHDLEHPEREGALRANVITFEDPNLGQIRFIKQFMRYALCQRCIVLFRDDNLLDEYITDLSLSNEATVPQHIMLNLSLQKHGFDVIPPDEDEDFFTQNKRRKIYLVDEGNEDRIEQSVSMALRSLRN